MYRDHLIYQNMFLWALIIERICGRKTQKIMDLVTFLTKACIFVSFKRLWIGRNGPKSAEWSIKNCKMSFWNNVSNTLGPKQTLSIRHSGNKTLQKIGQFKTKNGYFLNTSACKSSARIDRNRPIDRPKIPTYPIEASCQKVWRQTKNSWRYLKNPTPPPKKNRFFWGG